MSTCNTCQKIIQQLNPGEDVTLIDIKQTNIDPDTLDQLREKVGSYEALFSKRAMKFRSMGLNEKTLTEDDYRRYMLEEYTFLKRPFILLDDRVFVGNSAKEVAQAVTYYASIRG